jgi:O-antigen/teichoic acid export membrane protein
MDRTKKLKLNTISALINRVAIIISGLLLPRLILVYFGSEINGLVSSLTQFLSLITFLDLGVGSVVQSALYGPLARKNNKEITGILNASKKYFQNIGKILVIYIILLILFFPVFVDSSLNYFSTTVLILSLSISFLAQYYFGIVNELLLTADQKSYIQYGSETVLVILNIILTIILARAGASIEIVKIGSGFVYLIRPIYLSWYVRKNYQLEDNIDNSKNYLSQKWYGMGQHIAITIQNSTDIIVLTIFSTLENVSVYAIYNYIVQAIRMLITSLTTSMKSFFGDMLVNKEIKLLNQYFDRIEWLVHMAAIFLFGLTAVLISPFVMIYTSGINDTNYDVPLFSFFIVLASLIYSIRIPYQTLIYSAGHFKETQLSSYIEAGLNLTISSLMVSRFGLVGVSIGTLVAMLYRTVYLIFYLSDNIVYRAKTIFFKLITIDAILYTIIYLFGKTLLKFYKIDGFVSWIFAAGVISIFAGVIMISANLIFYRTNTIQLLRKIFKK